MFVDGVLNLFPPRGLDQSILVAVLVGVFVLLILTETLGWVWAGLVVPGYLASVFVIQPSSGMAICIEATITFVICRVASDLFSKTGGWSPFFGRERFFLIVLVSVFVRQACELYVLADLAHWLEHVVDIPLGHYQFSSIGLVLVPLLANMAWKLTLPRAVYQISITVVITWAFVALVLLRYTNLSYASLEISYEDVALDFLGSPKAYIILLTSAFVAARLNLSYGWDYNGILVPSLMALTWFDPAMAVHTMVEAAILVVATKAALASPLLRRRNLEGPRKLALVFSLGFVLKLVTGWVLATWWPLVRLTDLFGFGYVLTSLMAVKMITLNKTGRVLLPTLAVSLVGFVLGSGIGYGLEQIAPRVSPAGSSPPRVAATTRLAGSANGIAIAATVRARIPLPHETSRLEPAEIAGDARLWRGIDRWLARGGAAPGNVVTDAQQLGLRLVPLADDRRGCWGLLESEEVLADQRGWDSAVLCPRAGGPIVEVLRPRSQRPVAQAAIAVCARLDCTAIVFAGVEPTATAGPSASIAAAHRALAHRATVALALSADVAPGHPMLHVRHVLPDTIHVPALWPGEVTLSWEPPPDAIALWQAPAPRVVLRVHPDDAWSQLVRTAAPVAASPGISVFGWIDQWRVTSAPPPPPSQTELLALEELVVAPMLEDAGDRMAAIADLARALHHDVAWLPDGARLHRGAWVLAGLGDPGWIALAVAQHPDAPLVLEAPRPRTETGSGRLAAAAFQSSGATALLLDAEWAARAPGADVDYGDPIAIGEVATAFHAAHQALTRFAARAARGAVVEIRGYGMSRPFTDNVIVSLGTPLLDPRNVPAAVESLFARGGLLETIGGPPRWVDGGDEVAPLLGRGRPQQLYAEMLGVPFASVWISPEIRLRVLPHDSLDALRDRATRMAMPLVEQPLAEALTAGIRPGPPNPLLHSAAFAPAVELAYRYANTGDLALLALLRRERDVVTSLGWSPDLRAGYVLLEQRRGDAVARTAVVLGASRGPACATIAPGPDAGVEVWRAILRWCLRLESTGSRAP